MPVKQTTPWTAVARRVSGSVLVPTSSSAASTPSGTIARAWAATSPSSTSTWSTPIASSAATRSGWRVVARTVRPRSLARIAVAIPTDEVPADQQRLTRPRVKADSERAVGGLEHLGDRAQHRPVELGAKRDHLGGRHIGELRIAAVEGPAHA